MRYIFFFSRLSALNSSVLREERKRRPMREVPMMTPFMVLKFTFHDHETYGRSILVTASDITANNETFCTFLPKRFANELTPQHFKDFDPHATPLYFMVIERDSKTSYLKFANDVPSLTKDITI